MQKRWFGVRIVFVASHREVPTAPDEWIYEERITLWRERTAEGAMRAAEKDAARYVKGSTFEVTDLVQSYELVEAPDHGREAFSLMRVSALAPDAYLDHFFDTGTERQQHPLPHGQ